jgi:hypothetical protein
MKSEAIYMHLYKGFAAVKLGNQDKFQLRYTEILNLTRQEVIKLGQKKKVMPPFYMHIQIPQL